MNYHGYRNFFLSEHRQQISVPYFQGSFVFDQSRGVFRTQSNIRDEAFLRK